MKQARIVQEVDKGHYGDVIVSDKNLNRRMAIGVPMTGNVRAEWMLARYGQIMPCNWSFNDVIYWLSPYTPMQFTVPDARNYITSKVVQDGFEWLFFIDHDVVLPRGTLIKMNEHMLSAKHPIVSGVYFTKGNPSEPLVFRENGQSYYDKWKVGEQFGVRTCGLGCILIHVSILKAMYEESEEYPLRGITIRRLFRNPSSQFWDEKAQIKRTIMGTEDTDFFNRIKMQGIYAKAGWEEHQEMEHPILMDASIMCKHITPDGEQYPMYGEEKRFE